MPSPVLHEVGMRDGLQMEARVVPTAVKRDWIERLLAAGVDAVQIGSFVHPEKVPQMADTDELFRALRERIAAGGPTLSGLVLNERGLERALACGVPLVCMGVSASDTHSRKNAGMGTDEAVPRILAMAAGAAAAGRAVQVPVQSAFGCGYEGRVPPERVRAIVARYFDAGLTNVSLADTAGYAAPEDVERMFALLDGLGVAATWTCHFHNTYGLGIANCVAALRCGVGQFETSVAGLGGCPFTKVAGGNVCTEDFADYLRKSGRRSDVDLDALVGLAYDLAAYFGRELPGMLYKTRVPIATP